MGLFGFFNYEKEGPGIDKNAPKKKTFIVFFETFFRNFWKFVSINAVYSLLCIPIVTIGFANAGITNVTRNTARDKHSFGLSDFFDTVKKNWKQSLIAGIVEVAVNVFVGFSIYFYFYNSKSWKWSLGLGVTFFVLLVIRLMAFYVWTLIITFKFTLRQVWKNSFILVFVNFLRNLLCAVILLAVYALYIVIPFLLPYAITIAIEVILAVCTLPAFRFLLIQYVSFPAIKKYIIDPYYEAHPDDDIEQRRNLGVFEEEEIAEEDTEETKEE